MYLRPLLSLLVISFLLITTSTSQSNETSTPLPADSSHSQRIKGGVNATKSDFPPIVSLSKEVSRGNFENVCGGTIVHKNWVLTAAHCFKGNKNPVSKLRIRVGFIDLTNKKPLEPNEANLEVEKIVTHPKYAKDYFVSEDVALVKVKGQFESHRIAKVQDKDVDLSGLEATVLGWGAEDRSTSGSPHLQKLTQKICEKNWCLREKLKESMCKQLICYGWKSGRGTCDGDSGGPLIIGPEKVVVGVISFSRQVCSEGSYLQKVSRHVDWIEKTIGDKLNRADVSGARAIGPIGVELLLLQSVIVITMKLILYCN